jgi:hypothetical protein
MNNLHNKSYIYVITSNAISNTSKQFLQPFYPCYFIWQLFGSKGTRELEFVFFLAFGHLQMKKQENDNFCFGYFLKCVNFEKKYQIDIFFSFFCDFNVLVLKIKIIWKNYFNIF